MNQNQQAKNRHPALLRAACLLVLHVLLTQTSTVEELFTLRSAHRLKSGWPSKELNHFFKLLTEETVRVWSHTKLWEELKVNKSLSGHQKPTTHRRVSPSDIMPRYSQQSRRFPNQEREWIRRSEQLNLNAQVMLKCMSKFVQYKPECWQWEYFFHIFIYVWLLCLIYVNTKISSSRII